jgi:exodeoxyribonuclease V alpha subunit
MSSATILAPNRNDDPIELLSLLQKLGVPSELATQAASSMGPRLYQIINEEPYTLCEMLSASFFAVEAFATKLGFSQDHPQRIRAGVKFLLYQNTDGNCFSIRSAFLRKASRLLNINPHQVSQVLSTLETEGHVVPHGEHIWTKNLNDLEAEVATRILAMCKPAF